MAAQTWTRDELLAMADEIGPHWWHSIDFGQGVVTDGTKSRQLMLQEFDALRLPDLSGKSVLDIGAWDGGFSFECERRDASRVIALDHYIWSIDLDEKAGYSARCAEASVEPRPFEEVPEVWKPDTLPGKRGFDIAKRALGSQVEAVVGELETINLDRLGRPDVVLYLGVLYHVLDPYKALKRLAAVTGELAVIETEMFRLVGEGGDELSLFEFLPGSGLNEDPTNYWIPNAAGMAGMCRAAGFASATTFLEHLEVPPPPPARGIAARIDRKLKGLHAQLRRARHPDVIGFQRFRAVTHARK